MASIIGCGAAGRSAPRRVGGHEGGVGLVFAVQAFQTARLNPERRPQLRVAGLGPAPCGAVVADAASPWSCVLGWLFYAGIDPDEASAGPAARAERPHAALSSPQICSSPDQPPSQAQCRACSRRDCRAGQRSWPRPASWTIRKAESTALSTPATPAVRRGRRSGHEARHARAQPEPLFASADRRGGARARARDRRHQHAARAHEHHVEPADAVARRAPCCRSTTP